MARGANALLAGALLVAAAWGCGGGNKETKKDDPRIKQRDALLLQLRQDQQGLDGSHFRFVADATNYERDKDDYQKKLARAMEERKPSGKAALKALEENRGQLARMNADRQRFGDDLAKAFQSLVIAQKKRNAAAVQLLELEGKLWEYEEKAVGGRPELVKRMGGELTEMRTAAVAVREADRARADAQAQLIKKEVEVADQIGTDAAKRDVADTELDGLCESLESAITTYVGTMNVYEAAKDRYHRQVVGLLKAGPAREKILQLIDQRTNAAKLLDESQNVVKTATVDRARQTKGRIDYDSEIDRVVEAGLTKAVKDTVVAGLKRETDSISKERQQMQQEDTAALNFQRKIAETEAELNRIGY
jgi:hypothetical protein